MFAYEFINGSTVFIQASASSARPLVSNRHSGVTVISTLNPLFSHLLHFQAHSALPTLAPQPAATFKRGGSSPINHAQATTNATPQTLHQNHTLNPTYSCEIEPQGPPLDHTQGANQNSSPPVHGGSLLPVHAHSSSPMQGHNSQTHCSSSSPPFIADVPHSQPRLQQPQHMQQQQHIQQPHMHHHYHHGHHHLEGIAGSPGDAGV